MAEATTESSHLGLYGDPWTKFGLHPEKLNFEMMVECTKCLQRASLSLDK